MAIADYVVRRNAGNTDSIPNAGGDLLALWDTTVASVGTGIAYSGGTFSLGETGRFLVLCSDQAGSASTENNERLNWKMTLNLAGVELQEGYSTGYVRKSSGSQEAILFSAAIINVASLAGNGDDLQVRLERVDSTVDAGEQADRIADRSGITILKLDDSLGFGRYESTSAFATTTSNNAKTTANLQTTIEQELPFTRTTNNIDVASNNLILCVYSLKSEDVSPQNRTEFQSVVELGGAEVPGSMAQSYFRVTDNCDWGGMSNVCLLRPTSGQDVTLQIISREHGGEDFTASLQLVELPSGAEACIVEATTGNFNTAATNFSWDTVPHIDTAAFTHSAGDSNIDVDNAGDYLVMVSQAVNVNTGPSATRAVPAVQFRVNTTDDETAGSSTYHRNSGTAEHGAITTATLLTGLSASDSIHVRNDRIGTNTTAIACDSGGFAALRLSSIVSAAGGTVAATASAIGSGLVTIVTRLSIAASLSALGSGLVGSATGSVYREAASTALGSGLVGAATADVSRRATLTALGSGLVAASTEVSRSAATTALGSGLVSADSSADRQVASTSLGVGLTVAVSNVSSSASSTALGRGLVVAVGSVERQAVATVLGSGLVSTSVSLDLGSTSTALGVGLVTAAAVTDGAQAASASATGSGLVTASASINRLVASSALGVGLTVATADVSRLVSSTALGAGLVGSADGVVSRQVGATALGSGRLSTTASLRLGSGAVALGSGLVGTTIAVKSAEASSSSTGSGLTVSTAVRSRQVGSIVLGSGIVGAATAVISRPSGSTALGSGLVSAATSLRLSPTAAALGVGLVAANATTGGVLTATSTSTGAGLVVAAAGVTHKAGSTALGSGYTSVLANVTERTGFPDATPTIVGTIDGAPTIVPVLDATATIVGTIDGTPTVNGGLDGTATIEPTLEAVTSINAETEG